MVALFDLKAQRYDKLCLYIWILWLIDYCSALFCHISELFKELELQRESMLWKMIFCIQLVNLSRVSLQTTRFAVALALTLTKHIGFQFHTISIIESMLHQHCFLDRKCGSEEDFVFWIIERERLGQSAILALNTWPDKTCCNTFFTFIILEECAFALQMIERTQQ